MGPRRGEEAGPAFEHGGEVVQADVTPDGRTLLTVSREEVARLWEVPTRQPLGAFAGALTGTRLSSDGGRVVALLPAEARLHALARPLSRLEGLTPREGQSAAAVTSITVFPDGKRLLYLQPGADPSRGLVWSRDVPAGAEVQAPWEQPCRDVTGLALDPAGKVAAVASRRDGAGAVQLWDAAAGRPTREPWRLAAPAASLAFAPDGKEVAAGDERGGVRRWATASGQELPTLEVGPGAVTALAYRPDGKALAAAVVRPGGGSEVRVWNLETRNPGPTLPHPGWASTLEFGSDGQALLAGGRTATLWQLGQAKADPLEVRRVTTARFARGGQVVVIGTGDGRLLRFTAGGQSDGPAVPHPGAILAADLSADGKTLLVAGREGTLRLWDLEGVPRPLGPPRVANRPVLAARLAGDGRSYFSVADDGDVRVWPAARGEGGTVEELKRRVLVWTGREIDDAGLLAPVSADRWAVARANHAADPLSLDGDPAA
ncbi:MAG: WD40 repeat domain-containing protein, partial [Gemmataceae bacterium]